MQRPNSLAELAAKGLGIESVNSYAFEVNELLTR